ncbi:hypothetical protein [Nonomuraea sp. NPDC049784]|uniref:hypothetical protein n=1 Tax=Nonomuraea sp. NPDC049784 TaxID=3154361 RepID=UPI0033F11900
MLIRRPPAEVFQAFADPDVTTRFWFTKSTGKLTPGAHESGHSRTGDEVVAHVAASVGGFTIVLCAAKALLERGIELNAARDAHPGNLVTGQ